MPAVIAPLLLDANRAQLGLWLPWVSHMTCLADTYSFIQNSKRDKADARACNFGLFAENCLLGVLGLKEIDAEKGSAEIGHWLAGDLQGKGLIIASVSQLIALVFATDGIQQLTLGIAIEKQKSRASAERLGFVFKRTKRGAGFLSGKHVDHATYCLSKA